MKKIHFLIFILLLSNPLTAQEDVYENVAREMCGCVTKHENKLSTELKDVLIAASLDTENGPDLLTDYFMKEPAQGLKDSEALGELGDEGQGCMAKLEEKYNEIYLDEMEAEIQQRILGLLENKAECKFTAAILRIGISADEEESYEEEYGDEETE